MNSCGGLAVSSGDVGFGYQCDRCCAQESPILESCLKMPRGQFAIETISMQEQEHVGESPIPTQTLLKPGIEARSSTLHVEGQIDPRECRADRSLGKPFSTAQGETESLTCNLAWNSMAGGCYRGTKLDRRNVIVMWKLHQGCQRPPRSSAGPSVQSLGSTNRDQKLAQNAPRIPMGPIHKL